MLAVYDLARCPPTYDVIAYLSRLEVERKRRKEEDVALHILPGPANGFRQDVLWPRDVETRQHLRDTVLVPICKMLPSVRRVEVETTRKSRDWARENAYGYNGYIISLPAYLPALKAGERPLRCPDYWSLGPKSDKLITITLREADHHPRRNSRLDDWAMAARYIRDQGYRVLIIRDTARDGEPLGDLEVDTLASDRMNVRVAMYARARLNLGVNNGPMWLAIAMNAPVLMLKVVTDEAGGCYCSDWYRRQGLPPGSQLPTSPPHQRLVWELDTAQNIITAFDQMIRTL